MKKVIWYTTVVLMTLTLLVIIWQFSEGIVLFLLSFALAAAFRPLLEELTKRGLRKGLALILIYATFLITLGVLIMLGYGAIISDLQKATNDLINRYEWLKNYWLQGDNNLLANLAQQMPATDVLYTSLTGDGSGKVLNAILGFAQSTFTVLASIAMVVALSLYWSADQVRFERLWLSLFPLDMRMKVRNLWQAVESGVGAYIRREATLSLLAGIVLWIIYSSLEIRYSALLALIGALARLIPWLGIVLVILLPLIVGSNFGVWAGIAAAIASLGSMLLIDRFIGKKFFPSIRTNSILLVLVVIALANSFGVVGALLATILTVAIQIILKSLLLTPFERSTVQSDPTLESLNTKISQLKSKFEEEKTSPSSEAASLLERLECLLNKVSLLNKTE